MKLRTILSVSILALLLASPVLAVPTMDQVYQTARSGDLRDADHMMREVLQAHPKSAKAHYVYADILAHEGYKDQARDELSTAERIMPGLPFVTPQALANLQHQLNV